MTSNGYPTKDFLKAQHEEAKAKIKSMIQRMGLDEFVEWFHIVYAHVNKKGTTTEMIHELIEKAPKLMCLYIQMMENELKRKGIDVNE